ncbi:dihydrolipoyl dehydrogenase [Acinetobacter gerneri]|uniref:dihydrolipoyl dehydrogenase n=1 Tax=Acinetobacter gerneri TaxID=202952 RepID=UPI0029354758|nr:dihydrolipoyl dehydrogenase [Acinetobacter gerneri]MDV2440957.1 dihydrolipoyl dehydrogenase [Acinetobacter gerneri]
MYDIIIIGAGTAGISAYKEAIRHTQNILVINQGPWDTTCARVGCMPSKVLISTANRMHDILHADEVALNVKADIDRSQVMQHLRRLRDRFTAATLRDVESWDPQHKISGTAVFINENTVKVDEQHYQAKAFIIAVGSTPNIEIELKNKLAERLITSDQVFELEQLPRSLAVIGSGVIAIELAQAFQRLGVKTTVFARSAKVGVLTSQNLQKIAQQEISKELDIKFGYLPESFELIGDEVQITYDKENPQTLNVDYVLTAIGRKSNLSSLKLENIHPDYKDTKQLDIDANSKQLGQYPIFIVGDAYTSTPLQHEAAIEGKLAVKNCLNYPKIENIKTLTPLGIVFSSPEMAISGQNYAGLVKQGIEFVTGTVSYEKQGRAIVLGKNRGAVEVYVEKSTRRLLGAELLVESAEHMAHLLSWIISQQLSIDAILEMPFYHPTLEEGLRTALKHARRQLAANSNV